MENDKKNIYKSKKTAHNRIVYATPTVVGLASVRIGRCALTPHSSTFYRAKKTLYTTRTLDEIGAIFFCEYINKTLT
jgi:hypothetical protein